MKKCLEINKLDYQIVTASSRMKLEEYVRSEIKQGWKPLGAPFLADESKKGSLDFLQAMIPRHAL